MSASVEARWLFVAMLVIGDESKTGVVDMPIDRLASRAALTEEQTRRGLEELMRPDPISSSPDDEGRRIQLLDAERPERGWIIVNWERYKKIAREEARRDQTRRRVAAYRERIASESKAKAKAKADAKAKGDVTKTLHGVTERYTREDVRAEFETQGVTGDHWEGFYEWWEGLGWKDFRSLKGRVRTWISKRREEGRISTDQTLPRKPKYTFRGPAVESAERPHPDAPKSPGRG